MAGVFTHAIEVAIEAQTRADQERLGVVLGMLAAVDPSVGFSIDSETGQAVLRGLHEHHLALIVERLKHEHGIAFRVGSPQAAYRETLGRRSEVDYTHKKQSGGWGQFARVKLVFEPGAPGSGYSFESRIVGAAAVPKEFIPGVEKGLEVSRRFGLLAGFPVIDFKATLIDGAYHDVDSSVPAFEIAACAAFKEGLQKAQCKLLEPIMKVDVATPTEFEDAVLSDFKERRGRIQSIAARDKARIITAMAPMANMFGYATSLRMLTRQYAAHSMTFDHHEPIPAELNGGRGA